MKKLIFSIFIAAMLIMFCISPFSAYVFFDSNTDLDKSAVKSSAFLSLGELTLNDWAESIEEEHIFFQSVNGGDRRSFFTDSYNPQTDSGNKKGEQIAADKIVERLLQMGYSLKNGVIDESNEENGAEKEVASQIILDYFSEQFTLTAASLWIKAEEETRWSQNVTLRFDTLSERRVVVGANIDNSYDTGDGAMQSGGSVAVLLALAEQLYNNHKNLPFDLDIVFFGAGYYGGSPYFMGSENYLKKHSSDIALMINIGRLGGDKTYLYSDEVKTKLADYCIGLGNFNKLPANLPLTSTSSQGGAGNLPYAHYGLKGNHSRFIEQRITSVNFFSADFSGIILRDKDILKADTIQDMLAAYPDAYKNMAGTAMAISKMLNDGDLLQTVSSSNAGKFDYSIFLQKWVAYLVFAGFVLIGFAVLMNVSRRLVAKYPPAARTANVKKAVFGDDYEGKNNNNSDNNDPFR